MLYNVSCSQAVQAGDRRPRDHREPQAGAAPSAQSP